MASLRTYTGQAREALVMLRPIELDGAAGVKAGTQAGYGAWIHGLAAEACERLGEWDEAERHYRKALADAPGDNFLLVAYADFLLDRGRAREVVPLLTSSWQSDTAFLRLVLAEAALGSADTTRDTWLMAARFEALRQRGSDYYGREQVRFALHVQHDPQAALALALQNWNVQRAPWDARVALEAAKAAGRSRGRGRRARVRRADAAAGSRHRAARRGAPRAHGPGARGAAMRRTWHRASMLAALLASVCASAAWAHSASDAYLTLSADRATATIGTLVHAQWDIALRDLDFALTLDADGDGAITWSEVRARESAIARYVYNALKVRAGSGDCRIVPTALKIDQHADGAYAALLFDIACGGARKRADARLWTLLRDRPVASRDRRHAIAGRRCDSAHVARPRHAALGALTARA